MDQVEPSVYLIRIQSTPNPQSIDVVSRERSPVYIEK